MIVTLVVIGFLILFHVMMLKNNFSVKRNLPEKAIGYSRGNHWLSREIRRRIQKTSYLSALKRRTKTLLLQKKAHIREILALCMCPALAIYDHG
jgi:hypothetical protein